MVGGEIGNLVPWGGVSPHCAEGPTDRRPNGPKIEVSSVVIEMRLSIKKNEGKKRTRLG